MRLSRDLIQTIAASIAASLETKGLVRPKRSSSDLAARIAEVITADLAAEDQLNRDVEKVLAAYESEIARGNMDRRKVFELTKQKLAKERGMVL